MSRVNNPRGVLKHLCDQQKWKCHYCKNTMIHGPSELRPTIDHVIPRSKGGTNNHKNLVAACYKCNQIKGGDLPSEYILNTDQILKRLGDMAHVCDMLGEYGFMDGFVLAIKEIRRLKEITEKD
jgi:CRISPR/Cas system Type II protein with McrA/HNH and RuvC-like nuclease domain